VEAECLGPLMKLYATLQHIDAPQELLAWLDSEPRDSWLDCPRADWLVWMAACTGTPIVTVLEAALECVVRAVDTMPGGAAPLREAIEAARRAWTAEPSTAGATEACVRAAETCDEARRQYPETYRSTMRPGYPAAAQAAAWLARAAEGLATAEARSEAERVEEGRTRALTLGAHPDIMVPSRRGPARLDPSAGAGDPVQEELSYALAAAAQAVDDAALALAPSPEDPQARAEVRESFAERTRQLLPTPWGGDD